ncbi:MAG TPA: DUF58 domain-containing protein [Bacteroidia bacterium]|nr:DUF58 domain-containing protein [Bacteroidia bacterium]
MPINRQDLQQFTHLELLARQVVEGFITGLHKSPFHGFSVEFAEHRLYNSGEPTKHIDWKLYGRTDKMFVKRYEEETNLRCHIVIDSSSSMYFPVPEKGQSGSDNKLSFSVHCAAALTELLKMQRDAVGLTVFSEHIDLTTPARSSPMHHKMLFAELEKLLEPVDVAIIKKKTFAVDALHTVAESIHKRSLVIIFSDMFDSAHNADELFSALQHMRHNKHEVILFHVTDKRHELEFDYENRPYTFVDLETGEEVKVQPNEIRETYLKAITDFKHALKLRCGQYRIDFVEADINAGYRQVLLPYLMKRTRMM